MNKRTRLVIILAVIAMCFWFLWPSISWYARTPKEEQALALGSLENIKDYSSAKAASDVRMYMDKLKGEPDAVVQADEKWLSDQAVKNLKKEGKPVPEPLSLKAALSSFAGRQELATFIEGIYRDKILKVKKHFKNSVKLGLDLSGGMSVIVKADLDKVVENASGSGIAPETLRKDAMTQAIETLSSRIDRFGLSSPTIRQQGEDHIYIELPGSAEANQVDSIIQGRGILNFRLVDDEATQNFSEYYMTHYDTTFDSRGRLIDPTVIPEDCEVMGYYITDNYGLDQRQGYRVIKKEIMLDGKHIKSAQITSGMTGQPQVSFILDVEGAEIFGKFTAENVGRLLCIVSDSKIKSCATINEPIPNGQVAISGFSFQEAQNLQKVLQTAWLDVPLSVESQQVIGASLGDKMIRQGLQAIFIGLVAIMLFMLVWYHGAGFNACVGQVLNLYIMFSILSALNLTITLPTIAGMILTIGMAVDANVIIFERIKEEIRLGKDRAASIASGFGNAFAAIIDSNITTLIAAVCMVKLGSGAVQGFAMSLSIGVFSTLFTALVVSRLMFDFGTDVLKKKGISIGWGIK